MGDTNDATPYRERDGTGMEALAIQARRSAAAVKKLEPNALDPTLGVLVSEYVRLAEQIELSARTAERRHHLMLGWAIGAWLIAMLALGSQAF